MGAAIRKVEEREKKKARQGCLQRQWSVFISGHHSRLFHPCQDLFSSREKSEEGKQQIRTCAATNERTYVGGWVGAVHKMEAPGQRQGKNELD